MAYTKHGYWIPGTDRVLCGGIELCAVCKQEVLIHRETNASTIAPDTFYSGCSLHHKFLYGCISCMSHTIGELVKAVKELQNKEH